MDKSTTRQKAAPRKAQWAGAGPIGVLSAALGFYPLAVVSAMALESAAKSIFGVRYYPDVHLWLLVVFCGPLGAVAGGFAGIAGVTLVGEGHGRPRQALAAIAGGLVAALVSALLMVGYIFLESR